MLRNVKTRQFSEEALEARFLVRPVDVWAQPHQKARKFGEAGRVPLHKQRDTVQAAVSRNFEGEVFIEHVAAFEQLFGNQRGHFRPVERRAVDGCRSFFPLVRDSDFEQFVDVEWGFEAHRAEVAKVREAELVEVFVADHAIVNEEEFDASLDGGDAPALVDDADEGVASEDFS